MGNEPVRFAGEVTWPEYRHIRRRLPPWWGRTAIVLPAAMLVILWCAGDFTLLRNDPVRFVIDLMPFALLFAIAVGAGFLIERQQWKAFSRTQGKASGEVGAAGLLWKTETLTAQLPWDKITGYKLDDQLVLLYYSAMCAHVLPRSFFADEASWNALQALVKQHAKAIG